jgi:hypothetical protein
MTGVEIPRNTDFVEIFQNTDWCWDSSQYYGKSPYQSVFLGISTPVSVSGNLPTSTPGNLHTSALWNLSTSQCYGQSPLRGISIPVSCGISAPNIVVDISRPSQYYGQSPHQPVFWGISISVYSIDLIVTYIKTHWHHSRNQFGKDHSTALKSNLVSRGKRSPSAWTTEPHIDPLVSVSMGRRQFECNVVPF